LPERAGGDRIIACLVYLINAARKFSPQPSQCTDYANLPPYQFQLFTVDGYIIVNFIGKG